MLKSGKLKLADDMIVTAQEAANKAETVFTIYDDTTNKEIAKGPIGGGGGEGLILVETVNTVNNNPIMYSIPFDGVSIANFPEDSVSVGSISGAMLAVESEELSSENDYVFEFNDISTSRINASYGEIMEGMAGYNAALQSALSFRDKSKIIITFKEMPK